MPFAVLLVIFIVLVLLGRAGQRGGRSALLARGVPARGLILSANRTSSDVTYGGQRFEVRALVLDVEVPGKAPYEVSLNAMIPRICEALPGATLDLQVDPAKPNNLAIVGPAGSSQWLGAGATIPGQTWAGTGAARSGCGTVVLVLVAVFLALGSIVSFLSGAHETPPPTPTPSPLPHPAPAPRPAATLAPTATSPAGRRHPQCDAAIRCCETLGRASCQTFLSETEAACASVLLQEKTAALKAGKRCM